MDIQLMQSFEDLMSKKDAIYIGTLFELCGIGSEYLLVRGEIVAEFFNGNLVRGNRSGNTDLTIGAK